MSLLFSPTVTVSLDALLHNVAVLRSGLPVATGIIAVIKDCAYSCGAVPIAETLNLEAHIDLFAVATPQEALALKKQNLRGTIIILGKSTREQMRLLASQKCIFTLSDPEDLFCWQQYDFPFTFHIEIDTGMHRTGIVPSEIQKLIPVLKSRPSLIPVGIFTHFASADVPATESVTEQLQIFSSVITLLRSNGIHPAVIHTANSAALLRFPAEQVTHVRPGIALYGCRPDPSQSFCDQLTPVISLTGKVVSLRTVPANTPVSYGGTYTTTCQTCIATIGLGYAHGLPRYLSNRGTVLIGGKRYSIAGNITMDYCMVDAGLTHNMQRGDDAVFIGTQGAECITPDDIAIIGNTIGYEVLCNIGTNIQRKIVRNGRVISTVEPYYY